MSAIKIQWSGHDAVLGQAKYVTIGECLRNRLYLQFYLRSMICLGRLIVGLTFDHSLSALPTPAHKLHTVPNRCALSFARNHRDLKAAKWLRPGRVHSCVAARAR